MRKSTFFLPVLVIAIVAVLSAVFIVDEREKALVLQFGRVVTVKEDPGLAFKIPLIQEVVTYDDRILSREVGPLEVTPLDDRRLVVDAFARYRIADVRQFRQAVGAGGVTTAESRLDSILRAQTREVLGSVNSNDILSSDRATLMLRIRNGAITEARALGLEIIDVRLKRTDLPQANLEATFNRMRAEREREAADEIARGNEAAQRVRAQADRTVVELVSSARRDSEIVRGEADAARNRIYAEAFGQDPEFFAFSRSLTSYERALTGDNASMVLAPDSDFFRFLREIDPSGSVALIQPATAAEAEPATEAEPAAEPDAPAPAEAAEAEAPQGN